MCSTYFGSRVVVGQHVLLEASMIAVSNVRRRETGNCRHEHHVVVLCIDIHSITLLELGHALSDLRYGARDINPQNNWILLDYDPVCLDDPVCRVQSRGLDLDQEFSWARGVYRRSSGSEGAELLGKIEGLLLRHVDVYENSWWYCVVAECGAIPIVSLYMSCRCFVVTLVRTRLQLQPRTAYLFAERSR